MTFAFVFPGQGEQALGMGCDLMDVLPDSAAVLKEVGSIAGLPIGRLCREGPKEVLFDAHVSGLLVFAVSVAIEAELKKYVEPVAVAGYSVGQYAAMFSAGILDLESATRLVDQRGRILKRVAQENPACLIGVIGLTAEIVEEIVEKSEKVYVTSYSSPTNHSIACLPEDADRLVGEFVGGGALQAVKIPVAGGWHSPFVKDSVTEFRKMLAGLTLHSPKCAFYENVTGGHVSDPVKLKELLCLHLHKPIRWKEEVTAISKSHECAFIETGYGNQLSQFIKFANRRLKTFQTTPLQTFERTVETLASHSETNE